MLAHCRQRNAYYVSLVSLVLLSAKKMNCSALSMTRTAATSNGSIGGGGCGGGASPNNCAAEAAAELNGKLTKEAEKSFTNGIQGLKNGINIASTTPTNSVVANGLHQVSNNNHNANNCSSTTTSAATTQKQSKKPELAAKIIKNSHIVCFDVDSTVIQEEGIDELANYCGKGDEVARVTKEAMGGGMTFQDALKIRLNIIRPTQQQIAEFIKFHPSKLTRNVKCFIEQLKAAGKEVYLISGGFDCLIEPVARELNIPMTHVFANKLLFSFNGEYASFDTTQPTSKSGGKAEAISIIRNKHQNNQQQQQQQQTKSTAANDDNFVITMIGDGATDLEAVPPANYFIGFGGNVVRDEVFKRAQYFVRDFKELM